MPPGGASGREKIILLFLRSSSVKFFFIFLVVKVSKFQYGQNDEVLEPETDIDDHYAECDVVCVYVWRSGRRCGGVA